MGTEIHAKFSSESINKGLALGSFDLFTLYIYTSALCLQFSFIQISDLNYVEEVKGYTVSTKGHAVLVDQRNYTYNLQRKKANRIYWNCSKKLQKCKGRASTYGNYIMKLSGIHNHEPNHVGGILETKFDNP